MSRDVTCSERFWAVASSMKYSVVVLALTVLLSGSASAEDLQAEPNRSLSDREAIKAAHDKSYADDVALIRAARLKAEAAEKDDEGRDLPWLRYPAHAPR